MKTPDRSEHPQVAVKPMALALAVLALIGAGHIARADTTVVRNLGASGSGTFIEGGKFIAWSLGALPTGSFLKKVVINATLDSSNNQNYASELTLLVDPTPATPGGDFVLAIGNGPAFPATNSLTWINGDGFAPSTVNDTKNAGDPNFPKDLDLSTAGLFLGNGYGGPAIGGTWSGSISITYAAPTKVAASFSNLRPSQTLSAGSTSVSLSGTLSGSGSVYPTNGDVVHVTLNGVTQNATISGGLGAFSLTYAASALWPKDTPYTITYGYDGNATTLLSAADTSTTLTLSSRTVPIITWPTASNITYGQALGASTFSGGSALAPGGGTVAGTFAFTAPATKPTAAGSYVASGTFTPSNTASYATVVAPTAFSLTVNPKTLTLTSAAVTPKTYDGTTAATLTGTLTGVETGDAGAVGVVASGAFASTGAGSNIGVNAACTLNGTQAGNYTLTQPGGLTGNITRAALTATANNLGSLVGTALPSLTYTLSGFQNNEDAAAATVTGVPILSTTATLASPIGVYPITCTVNTLAAPNYSFTAANGTLFIVSN
ncbi:MAG: MBG domain-containing protein, partial [Verrucomicrobiota bacterium]